MASSRTFSTSCLKLVILISFCHASSAFMDMDELKSVYYGLDILKEPVSISQEVPVGAVQVTSKYGQHYQCTFPDHSTEEKRKEEEEKLAMETGIVEMLRPMGDKDCLFKAKDWWSYEFCFGKYIRQFHMEQGEIVGNVIYLGYFNNDFDWENQTAREDRLKIKSGQSRYHSQSYTKGTACDLTGQPRTAEVRFICEENSEDYLIRVDESETCVYRATVATSRICRHPYLKAPARRRHVSITCNPLLTENQFNNYQKEKEERQQKEKELRANTDPSEMDKILENELSKAAKELLGKPIDDLFSPSHKDALGRDEFEKIFGSDDTMWMSYLQRLRARKEEQVRNLEKMKKLVQDMQGKDSDINKEKVEESVLKKMEDEKKGAADEEVLSQFNKEIKEIKSRFDNSHNSITEIKKKIAKEKHLETEIEKAIQEAEQELGVKVDRNLVSGLSNTLDKLLNKLHDTEAELTSAGEELDKLKPGKPVIATKEDDKSSDAEDESDSTAETPIHQQPSDMNIQAPPKTGDADQHIQGNGPPGPNRPLTMEEEQQLGGSIVARFGNNGNKNTDLNNDKIQQTGSSSSHVSDIDTAVEKNEHAGVNDKTDYEDDDEDAELTITLRKLDENEEEDEKDSGKPQLPQNVQKLLEDSLKKEFKNKHNQDSDSKPLSFDTDHSFQREQRVHVIQSEGDDGKTNRYIFVFGFNTGNDETAERQRFKELEDSYSFVYQDNTNDKITDDDEGS